MALGMEVALGPGHNVLAGDSARTQQKVGRAPPPTNFRPISIVAKRLDASRRHLIWMYSLVRGHILLDVDPASPPKRGHSPPIFGPCLMSLNG